MKRITNKELEEISLKLLEEVYLHFTIKNVFMKETKQSFSFWNEKELDVILQLRHYCNLKDITLYDEDIEKFFDVLIETNKNSFNYGLTFTEFSTIKFYLNNK